VAEATAVVEVVVGAAVAEEAAVEVAAVVVAVMEAVVVADAAVTVAAATVVIAATAGKSPKPGLKKASQFLRLGKLGRSMLRPNKTKEANCRSNFPHPTFCGCLATNPLVTCLKHQLRKIPCTRDSAVSSRLRDDRLQSLKSGSRDLALALTETPDGCRRRLE
jgi:hypothetical protein